MSVEVKRREVVLTGSAEWICSRELPQHYCPTRRAGRILESVSGLQLLTVTASELCFPKSAKAKLVPWHWVDVIPAVEARIILAL